MNKIVFFILTVTCLFSSCTKKEDISQANAPANKILMLQVDFVTNVFKGGIETIYSTTPSTFTINYQYKPPGDFGNLKIRYQELNELLFDGDIIWMGRGSINFPQNTLPPGQFASVTTADIITPTAGFHNIFNPGNAVYDYTPAWLSVQKLVKVRDYIKANPNAPVNLFLYTPSVGAGNAADWSWIIFLKN